MEFSFEFDGEPQDVTIVTSGTADVAGFKSLTAELVSHPGFRAGMAILVDNSALDETQMSERDALEAMQPMLERDWNFPPTAVAVVVSTPHSFERAGLAAEYMGVLKAPRGIFYSREEALDWLRRQKSPAG